MRWFARPPSPAPAGLGGGGHAVDALGIDGLGLPVILDEAVTHLDAAERLLERCAQGNLGAADARESLRLRIKFTQLSRWVETSECPPEHILPRDEAACLLQFYLLMVKYAVDAAYAPSGRRQMAIRAGCEGDGDGGVRGREVVTSAAVRMVALRDALRRQEA